MVHYSVRAKSRRLRPQYEIESAEQVYADIGLFEKWTIEWAIHIQSYLTNKERFFGVHYEDLVENPEETITGITDYICPSGGVPLEDLRKRIGSALEATDRETFRAQAPDHMHKGRPGGWKEEWSRKHIELFLDHAGHELSRLGYVQV
jgi:hypothetical protein